MMRFNKLALPILATLSLASAMPGSALAQQRGNHAQRAQNAQDTANMRMRLDAAIERVKLTEQHGKISPARSTAVRRQLAQAQRELEQQRRRQGFVSTAQLAVYARLVVAVDAELGAGASGHAYGNDALPSAEVTAFKRADARLRYRNASIQYDANNCAVYQGTARDGRVRREPLRGDNNRPICTHQ
jgi:hypothetical protein